jgi:hypothetical protein
MGWEMEACCLPPLQAEITTKSIRFSTEKTAESNYAHQQIKGQQLRDT